MILNSLDRISALTAAVHAVIGIVCVIALFFAATPILGVHPALKPVKFAFSIAVFLGTMSMLLPLMSVAPSTRRGLAWVLSITMVIEMVIILTQSVRGTTSHFNMQGALNIALWNVMMVAIVVATIASVVAAYTATFRPLIGINGNAIDPITATAWRAGLWLFLLSAVSGFSMGGRLQHSVGGLDSGPGMAITNWSITHGDLRVSHFVSMHALQVLPLIGTILMWMPLGMGTRWVFLILAIFSCFGLSVLTLILAFASRPV